jgi:predicted glycogen debranching enzyme
MPIYSYDTQGQLEPYLSREWLLTNGLGAFTSSTVVGCNTRRYHALLCAATMPPLGRVVALNHIRESLQVEGVSAKLEFSVNTFRDRIQPRGDRYLRRFELDVSARWEYEVEGVRIIKEVQPAWMRNTVAIRYHVDPRGRRVRLTLSPFVSLRDFHTLLRRSEEVRFDVAASGGGVSVTRDGLRITMSCDSAPFRPESEWWMDHFYSIENDRGLDDVEDLFTPGAWEMETSTPKMLTIVASTQGDTSCDWDQWQDELVRHRPVPADASRTIRRLTHAAADFVVARKRPDGAPGTSVIAGYPWFADWGRDTMIALPGLFLETGRFEQARQVLCVFADHVDRGMIPNRFNDYTNEPEYNTVDASLWFIHACFQYLRATGDSAAFEKSLLPACRKIIDGYKRGTRYHIGMDESDGLVSQGDETTQLTWMDAKCGDIVFTPRQGKAVEINALWYNALVLMEEQPLASKVRQSFRRTFDAESNGLLDVVDGPRVDASIRPNQIFAVSLPHSPIDRSKQLQVVETVRRELLTPFGLRSLAPGDPKFQPFFKGDQHTRDKAYHNGTIWSWLIGPFLDAYLRVHDSSGEAVRQARSWLAPLIESMETGGCVGQIFEVFEAQPPHRPVGCFAQAWSVAETLRLARRLGL